MKPSRKVVVAALLCLSLAACAPSANDQERVPGAQGEVAGFWLGLWHGVIAPVTFVVSLFSVKYGMYEVHNNGGWYDLGFLIGLGSLHGGGVAGRRAKRRRG